MKHIYDYTAEYAAGNPDKAALSDEYGSMSYGELERRSSAIAARLVSLGVKPGQSVAVYVPYVKEIVLGTYAAIRSGGVYVPLDASYPGERLAFILQDCAAAAVLTLHSVWERAPLNFPEDRVLFMDDTFENAPFVSPDIPMDAPAMILYTSGTTGRPKGVVLPHTQFVCLMDWTSVNEGTEVTENTRAGIMGGLTFSGTTLILYSPLMYGGTSILAPEAARRDIDLLYAFLRKERITHIFMASSLAAALAERCDVSGINIFAGGEKLRNFRPLSPGTRIINTYGCTELGGTLSMLISGDEAVVPNGFAAPDSKVFIADDDLKPVETGKVGELLISSRRMARAYLGLPEQTKAKWVELDGETWFRTGDRARCTEDGVYYILGRTDNMVKLRGFRIETGEVEAQIAKAVSAQRSDVKNIVVVLRNINGIDHLTCYYESETELDTEAVSGEISKALASYMVPDIYVCVSSMPRNANGKIIRSELPEPKLQVSAPGIVYNETEARVMQLCASVLKIRSYISPDDLFSALGGTSLKAMEFASELSNIGIFISGSDILRLDRLRDIAEASDVRYERFWSAAEYERIRVDFASRRERIRKVLPLTEKQDELLFEQILHPDDPKFRNVYCMEIDTALPEYELCEVLDELSEEFEELRASIVYHGVTTFQQVITDRKIPLRVTEIPDSDEYGLKRIYDTLRRRPGDMQKESYFQVVYAHYRDSGFLFILDYMARINIEADRRYILRLMELLADRHPEDSAVSEWKELLSLGRRSGKKAAKKESSKEVFTAIEKRSGKERSLIHTYSSGHKKQLVFVHTGNTGSEAYYNLAERIKKDYSFAVIEPYNLYHPEEAEYGIKNIAERYVRLLKDYQPEGPYILGGWCYGGIVAHEMASQLQAAGETVECLFMLDSHVVDDEESRKAAIKMHKNVDREYFETSALFEGMKRRGMLESLIENSMHVSQDMITHIPSQYHGPCCYFRPKELPASSFSDGSAEYWRRMTFEHNAGGFENYVDRDKLLITETPHEHDLMMDEASLDIIVPEMYRVLQEMNMKEIIIALPDSELPGTHPPLRVEPLMDSLDVVQEYIADSIGAYRLSPLQYQKIEVAVDEIFSNIVNHSQALFAEILCVSDPESIRITFKDDGIAFDPLICREQKLTKAGKVGGQGIRIVKELMDQVNYCRENGMNILTVSLKNR